MEREKEKEINGRKYIVVESPDMPAGAFIIVGPPEGLVDQLGLPEPTATRLHNILFDRRIFKHADLSNAHAAMGVLQDTFQVDAQKLMEAFFEMEKETV